jgi:hypothetical protein
MRIPLSSDQWWLRETPSARDAPAPRTVQDGRQCACSRDISDFVDFASEMA